MDLFKSIARDIQKAMSERGMLPWPWPIDDASVKPHVGQNCGHIDSIVVELFFTPDVTFENVKQGQRAKTALVYHANTITRWERTAAKEGASAWARVVSGIMTDALTVLIRETRRARLGAACVHAEQLRNEERKHPFV